MKNCDMVEHAFSELSQWLMVGDQQNRIYYNTYIYNQYTAITWVSAIKIYVFVTHLFKVAALNL